MARHPDGGVIELRVHGIGGPTPEDLLDDPRPRQVAGDEEAGFFVRRWSGPEDHGVPGEVHGYSWRGMNTRSRAKALWLLLAPFALANIAGYMVRPAKTENRRRHIEGVLRAAQLSLTLYLVFWLVSVAVDQFAYQCGARAACRDGRWFSWVFSSGLLAPASRRLTIGAVLVLAALALLCAAARSPRRYERFGAGAEPSPEEAHRLGTPLADREFWARPETVRDLFHVHLGAGFALLGGFLGHAAARLGGDRFEWLAVLAAGAAGLVVAGAFVVLYAWSWHAGRVPEDGRRWWSSRAGRSVVAAGGGVLVAGFVVAAVAPGAASVGGAPTSPLLPGLRGGFYAVVGSQVVLLAALAAACAPWTTAAGALGIGAVYGGWRRGLAATGDGERLLSFLALAVLVGLVSLACLSPRFGRPLRDRIPKLRDEAGDRYHLAPFLVSVLAYTLFYGFAAAFAGWAADLLGDRVSAGFEPSPPPPAQIALSVTEEWNALGWCVGLTLVAVAVSAIRLRLPAKKREQPPCSEVRCDYAGHPDRDTPAAQALLAGARDDVARSHIIPALYDLLAVSAAVAIAVVVTAGLSSYPRDHPVWSPARSVTTLILAGVAVALAGAIRSQFRDEGRRRTFGLVWDLMAFWPRRFHPLAPAVYSERAVPELAGALARATATGRVVVSAHSQGSVLACCALMVSAPAVRARTVLVTHGSPLAWLYARFFPEYFPRQALARLAGELGDGDAGPRWVNFYRWTDPVGGPIGRPDDRERPGEGAPRVVDLDGAGIDDQRLPDPADLDGDGDPPRIKGHGHYFEDPSVRAAVAAIRVHLHLAGTPLDGRASRPTMEPAGERAAPPAPADSAEGPPRSPDAPRVPERARR